MSENIQSISQGTFTIGSTSSTNFEAGPGISITQPSEGTVRIANDETVLYSGDTVVNESNTFNLSESLFNFDSIKIYDKSMNASAVPLRVTEISFRDNTQTYRFGTNDVWVDGYMPTSYASHYQGWNFYSADVAGTTIATMGSWISHMNNSAAPTVRNIGHIYEIRGINRISGGNE